MEFDLFKNSNKTIELMQEYVQTRTDDPGLFESNVMDEDNLDDWTIDDFLIALPKTIKWGLDETLFNLTINFNMLNECSIYYENKELGKTTLVVSNINTYDAFKEIYNKVKTLNKID